MIQESELSTNLKQANNYYREGQFQYALKKYLNIDTEENSRLSDKDKASLYFNIGLTYMQLNKPNEAKKYVDSIKKEELIDERREQLALLYESLAILFKINYNEKEKLNEINECFKLAAEYHYANKNVKQSLKNYLEVSQLLIDNKNPRESIIIADKVLDEIIHLDDKENDSAQIINNLAVVYCCNNTNEQGLKLLEKNIQIDDLKDHKFNTKYTIRSNYVAALNQMNKIPGPQHYEWVKEEFNSQVKAYYYFNLASNKYYCGEYESANEYFLKALNRIPNPVDKPNLKTKCDILEFISECYFKLKDYQNSYENLKQALEIAHSSKSKKRINSKLENNFESLEQHEKKADREEYMDINISTVNEVTSKKEINNGVLKYYHHINKKKLLVSSCD